MGIVSLTDTFLNSSFVKESANFFNEKDRLPTKEELIYYIEIYYLKGLAYGLMPSPALKMVEEPESYTSLEG